jgi:hypothetical protein
MINPRRLSVTVLGLLSVGMFPTRGAAQDSTTTIRYKGVTVTPIGFVAAEGVWRQRNITADIGSSYNAIPFSGTTNGHLSEARLTGRQSRIGIALDGKMDATKLSGFWESDFLGVGTSSNSNESNSYVLRLRQFYGAAAFSNGWTLSAGQMWSLATSNKKGLANRTEVVPATIEAQYSVGFNWARQFGFRAVKSLGSAASVGVAIEESQTTFSARNAPTNFVLGQAGGSLLNATTNYSTDATPDVVAKLAFDPAGKGHWELKAIGREMRDRVIDPTNTAGGSRNVATGAYGVGFGAYIPMMHGSRDVLDIGLNGLVGKGIGRYGSAQLPDATVDVDGSLKPIKAAHALLSLESHPTPKLDVYGYAGAEYADRTAFVNAAGKGVGYGSELNNNSGCETEAAPTNQTTPNSGTCNADTRSIYQGSLGFWYRFYKGASGTMQWGLQYSYTARNTWSGQSIQPKANDSMLFGSFRYVLP